MAPTLTIGLFGIGLDTYWDQFTGLKERLEGYLQEIHDRLAALHPHIINVGLVDTVEKAFTAGSVFRRSEVDLIFLYVSTYALSSTVLPVVQRAGVTVILLDLSPAASIDYVSFNSMADRTRMTGEWLAFCSPCPVPEIANVFRRVGIPFHSITGMLRDDPDVDREIAQWVAAAKVKHVMAFNRLGCMGHYYSGMLDIYTDLTQQYAVFGGHIELIEVEDLVMRRRLVSGTEVAKRVALFFDTFDIQADCPAAELEKAARTSVALDRLVSDYGLGSLAYYYKGTGNPENEEAIGSIILGTSLLTGRGIPVAGEYEIKNAQAMKILDCLDAGGSFTEYYAMDFSDDVVLMGHDGPGHIAIAEGKTKVRPLRVYHGKAGSGLSVEMSVRNGPVTLLSVVERSGLPAVDRSGLAAVERSRLPDASRSGGGLFLLVAEGESVPGPILKIGNTNSRYRFPMGAKAFVQRWNSYGPAHHCAVGVGHIAAAIDKLGALLGLEVVKI